MMRCNRLLSRWTMLASVLVLVGCESPTIFPNPDPNLRKSKDQFAADAGQRFPYKADAPRAAEPRARAQVGYFDNRVEVVNFTDEDWNDVEIWVNRQYVCFVPKMESRKLKEIQFTLLYNESGQHFPRDGARVESVDIYRDGTMYSLVVHNADY